MIPQSVEDTKREWPARIKQDVADLFEIASRIGTEAQRIGDAELATSAAQLYKAVCHLSGTATIKLLMNGYLDTLKERCGGQSDQSA